MDRSPSRITKTTRLLTFALALATLVPSTGCLHLLIASGIYIWQGGNVVPAECAELEGQRVVVFCQQPVSSGFRYSSVDRQLTKAVSKLLRENVPDIEVVDPREVEEWYDETGSDDYRELGRAVEADRVLVIDLQSFDLYKGTTLYQGNANVEFSVYDMNDNGELLWDFELGQYLFPSHSAIPSHDKPVEQFQREFVDVLATKIAVYFYKHDPNADFALDAMANR